MFVPQIVHRPGLAIRIEEDPSIGEVSVDALPKGIAESIGQAPLLKRVLLKLVVCEKRLLVSKRPFSENADGSKQKAASTKAVLEQE